jgi:hypothetical protein
LLRGALGLGAGLLDLGLLLFGFIYKIFLSLFF